MPRTRWAANIARLLADRNWKPADLARQGGFRPATISAVMKKPNVEMATLLQIAKVLRVDPMELLRPEQGGGILPALLSSGTGHQHGRSRQISDERNAELVGALCQFLLLAARTARRDNVAAIAIELVYAIGAGIDPSPDGLRQVSQACQDARLERARRIADESAS